MKEIMEAYIKLRILLAEDRDDVASLISRSFTDLGHNITFCKDGTSAAQTITKKAFDILIMECILPGTNGFDITRNLRASDNMIPIILMTQHGSEKDIITGLDSGADYCFNEPTTNELAACVRAISRRYASPIINDRLSFGDLTLNLTNYTLHRGSSSVRLGHKEFEFMKIFMTHRSSVLTKQTLYSEIWGGDSTAELNSVEVYISFLRSKLRKLKSEVKIMTIRECGYYIEAAA